MSINLKDIRTTKPAPLNYEEEKWIAVPWHGEMFQCDDCEMQGICCWVNGNNGSDCPIFEKSEIYIKIK